MGWYPGGGPEGVREDEVSAGRVYRDSCGRSPRSLPRSAPRSDPRSRPSRRPPRRRRRPRQLPRSRLCESLPSVGSTAPPADAGGWLSRLSASAVPSSVVCTKFGSVSCASSVSAAGAEASLRMGCGRISWTPRPAGTTSVRSSSCSSNSMKSETYRKASRSSPISTNADCMPGSTRVTFPL